MKRQEAVANRRLTDAFIRADAQRVIVRRSTNTKNARGGETLAPPDQWTIEARIVSDVRARSVLTSSPGGITAAPTGRVLIARYNEDIIPEDEIVAADAVYKVMSVWENRTFETRAILLET